MTSIIYGIGVGPGDPELLTLKAARLIGEADIIAYPAPEQGESFARHIAASFIKNSHEEFPIRMNIGDGSFPKDEIYDKAASYLLEQNKTGKKCVILCEGDPLFFGSFYYLYERLHDKALVQIVPGVSSLMACAAVSGRPLTFGSHPLHIFPATLPPEELEKGLRQNGCAAIMKIGRHLPKVREILTNIGKAENAYYVEHATLPSGKNMKLSEMTEATAPYFSMILVGQN